MNKPTCTCFIVPTKMLRQLADAAQGAERQKLLDTALLSERLRGQRSVMGQMLLANVAGEKRRTIYDCRHKQSQPPRGKLIRGEGAPPMKDVSANEAYDNSGITYDFYSQVLKRNSIDGRGMRLDSFVNFGRDFNNAFWDGAEMVYGNGDQKIFVSFTKALEVVAHELTHGVTQHRTPGGLDYHDQSGALNESFSDALGCAVKQWHLKQTASEADWLVGAGILNPSVGKALRSLKSPGDKSQTWAGDDQPSTMSGYVEGGDVHTNSGIPNHAFYLASTALGGATWEKAAQVWYRALPMLNPDATFADAANATIEAASTTERAAVQTAWKKVEVIS